MVIVDTSVWIDYLSGTDTPEAAWLDRELDRRRLGLLDINLLELIQGVSTERQASGLKRELLRFEVLTTGGVDLAVEAARPACARAARPPPARTAACSPPGGGRRPAQSRAGTRRTRHPCARSGPGPAHAGPCHADRRPRAPAPRWLAARRHKDLRSGCAHHLPDQSRRCTNCARMYI